MGFEERAAVGVHAGGDQVGDDRTVRSGRIGTLISGDFSMPSRGDWIDGRYLVDDEIGRGGMGVVFRAFDVNLDRLVALKVMRPEVSLEPGTSARFHREARALAALRSEHVVPIHAFGLHGAAPFFVMAFVSGASLASIVRAHTEAGAALPIGRALDILARLAAGLDDVHGAGLVHRDVKPENVIVERDTGRAVLVDFGLVTGEPREQDAFFGDSTSFAGTPGYVAPEVCMGGQATPRSDQYAFACIAFEALTGRAVFEGRGGLLILRHVSAEPPSASSIRPALAPVDGILARGLAKDPRERFASCTELAQAIARALVPPELVVELFPPAPRPCRSPLVPERSVLIGEPDPMGARMTSRAAALVFGPRPTSVVVTDSRPGLLAQAASRPPDLLVVDADAPGLGTDRILPLLDAMHPDHGIRIVAWSTRRDARLDLSRDRGLAIVMKPARFVDLLQVLEVVAGHER